MLPKNLTSCIHFLIVYFDVSQACHSMDFSFGQNALGLASAVTNRRFSIHTSLIPCSSPNKAPTGCLQWFFGTSGTGSVSSFNYAEGEHLGDQVQTICFRYIHNFYINCHHTYCNPRHYNALIFYFSLRLFGAHSIKKTAKKWRFD